MHEDGGEEGQGGCPRQMSVYVAVGPSALSAPSWPMSVLHHGLLPHLPSTIFLFFLSAPALALLSLLPPHPTLSCSPLPGPCFPAFPIPSHSAGAPPCPACPTHGLSCHHTLAHPTSSPDWQVTLWLWETSLEQAYEHGHFSQEAQLWEQSLEQMQWELVQA